MNKLFLKYILLSAFILTCVGFFKPASAISIEPISIQQSSTVITPELNEGLSLGSRGVSVETLQRTLSSISDIYPEKFVTGYYGLLTKKAIERFQQRYGLSVTGAVDSKTLEKVNEFGSITLNRNPKISNLNYTILGPRNTIISWKTDELTTSEIYYSSKPLSYLDGRKLVVRDPSFEKSHTVELTNLTSDTTYYVKVVSINQKGMGRSTATLEFTTVSR